MFALAAASVLQDQNKELRARIATLEEALRALIVAVDEGPASLVRQCMSDARAAIAHAEAK